MRTICREALSQAMPSLEGDRGSRQQEGRSSRRLMDFVNSQRQEQSLKEWNKLKFTSKNMNRETFRFMRRMDVYFSTRVRRCVYWFPRGRCIVFHRTEYACYCVCVRRCLRDHRQACVSAVWHLCGLRGRAGTMFTRCWHALRACGIRGSQLGSHAGSGLIALLPCWF